MGQARSMFLPGRILVRPVTRYLVATHERGVSVMGGTVSLLFVRDSGDRTPVGHTYRDRTGIPWGQGCASLVVPPFIGPDEERCSGFTECRGSQFSRSHETEAKDPSARIPAIWSIELL